MRSWSPEQIAQAAGARLLSVATNGSGPERAVVDSRDAGPGALFVGVRGTRADGGQYATDVLRDGAWGVLTSGEHAETAAEHSAAGVVLAADDPLVALQRLATAWRRELGAAVIGVTGSTGKTSTKDLLLAVLAPHRRTVASRGNFNTEVGLPLEILAAPAGTEVLVLEMAMRGAGQIAELAAIAEPDVGVIVSVGPVHLGLLGSLDAIAAAKAELLAGLAPGATAVVPAGEPLLERHLRDDLETVTFGDEGDVRLLGSELGRVEIGVGGERITLRELANMTSGLADDFANPEFSLSYLTGETFTPTRLVELGVSQPTLFAPGTAWAYSNTNTVLLGIVIQKVTEQPLAAALKRRVFAPLGLRETLLPSFRPLIKPYASGYTYQTVNGRLGDATFNTPTATWAAGGIVSTVPDLLRAARLFGTGKPLLSAASQRQRTRWVGFPPNSPIQRYGIGVFDFDGWIGHNGGIPGYTTIAWYLPQHHLSLVVAVNSDIHVGRTLPHYAYEPASEIGHLLTRILSPNHVAPAAVKVGGTRVTAAD